MNIRILFCALLFACTSHAMLKEASVAALRKEINNDIATDISAYTDDQVEQWEKAIEAKITRYWPSDPPGARVFRNKMAKKIGDWYAAAARGPVVPPAGPPPAPLVPPRGGALTLFTPGAVDREVGPIIKLFNDRPQEAFNQLLKWLQNQKNAFEQLAINKEASEDLKRRIERGEFNEAYNQYMKLFNALVMYQALNAVVQAYTLYASIAIVYTFAAIFDVINAIGITVQNQEDIIDDMASRVGEKLAISSANNNTLQQLISSLQDDPNTLIKNPSAIVPAVKQVDLTPFNAPIVSVKIAKAVLDTQAQLLEQYHAVFQEFLGLINNRNLLFLPENEWKEFKDKIFEKVKQLQDLDKQLGIETAPTTESLNEIIQDFEQARPTVKILSTLLYGPLPIVYKDDAKTIIDWEKTNEKSEQWKKEIEKNYNQLPKHFRDTFYKIVEERIDEIENIFSDLESERDEQKRKSEIERINRDIEREKTLSTQARKSLIDLLLSESQEQNFLEKLNRNIMKLQRERIENLIKDITNPQQKEEYQKKLKEVLNIWEAQILINERKNELQKLAGSGIVAQAKQKLAKKELKRLQEQQQQSREKIRQEELAKQLETQVSDLEKRLAQAEEEAKRQQKEKQAREKKRLEEQEKQAKKEGEDFSELLKEKIKKRRESIEGTREERAAEAKKILEEIEQEKRKLAEEKEKRQQNLEEIQREPISTADSLQTNLAKINKKIALFDQINPFSDEGVTAYGAILTELSKAIGYYKEATDQTILQQIKEKLLEKLTPSISKFLREKTDELKEILNKPLDLNELINLNLILSWERQQFQYITRYLNSFTIEANRALWPLLPKEKLDELLKPVKNRAQEFRQQAMVLQKIIINTLAQEQQRASPDQLKSLELTSNSLTTILNNLKIIEEFPS